MLQKLEGCRVTLQLRRTKNMFLFVVAWEPFKNACKFFYYPAGRQFFIPISLRSSKKYVLILCRRQSRKCSSGALLLSFSACGEWQKIVNFTTTENHFTKGRKFGDESKAKNVLESNQYLFLFLIFSQIVGDYSFQTTSVFLITTCKDDFKNLLWWGLGSSHVKWLKFYELCSRAKLSS